MITVQTENINTLSQKIYDSIIDRIQLHQISCSCGHSGNIKKWGRYERKVWFQSEEITLKIQRIRCAHCGRTHAFLLDILVPYSRVPLEDQRQIILSCENGEDCEPLQQSNILIENQMVFFIWRKYRRHWKQKLLAAGISLTGGLSKDCFRCYSRQFMQIRSTPNLFFSPPT